jgi:hypothetical protein
LFSTVLKLQQDKTTVYNAGNDLLESVYDAAKSATAIQFDLADCKLTPDVIPTIRNYMSQGIEFIDTRNSWRNTILAENRKRLSINTSAFINMPKYDPTEQVLTYVQSLSKDVTYKIPYNEPEIYIPLTYIVMVARPSIRINIAAHNLDFFSFIGSRLTLADIENYTEFYFTTQEGTIIVKLEDGLILTQKSGRVDLESALTIGYLVPTVLGRDKIIQESCWNLIFKECLGLLNGYRATKKLTLDEVLLLK